MFVFLRNGSDIEKKKNNTKTIIYISMYDYQLIVEYLISGEISFSSRLSVNRSLTSSVQQTKRYRPSANRQDERIILRSIFQLKKLTWTLSRESAVTKRSPPRASLTIVMNGFLKIMEKTVP